MPMKVATPSDSPVTSLAALPSMPSHLVRWGRVIIYCLIVLYPLVYLPATLFFFNAYDAPRRLVLLIAAGLLGGLLVLAWAERGRIIWRRSPIDVPVGLFLAALVLTGLTSAYPGNTFFGQLWSQENTLPLWGACIVIYLGVKEFLRESEDIETAVTLMVLTGGVVTILGLLDHYGVLKSLLYFVFSESFSGKRLVATMGNSMFTGTYLAMLAPVALGAGLARFFKRRPLMRGDLVLGAGLVLIALFAQLALYLTLARAAQVGFLTAVLIGMVLFAIRITPLLKEKPRLAYVLLFVLCALPVLGISLAFTNPAIRQRSASVVNMEDDTIKTRLVYMQAAYNAFLSRPIQGWGAGNMKYIFPQFRPSSQVVEQQLPINRGYTSALPHNLFLQVAAETGLLGLVPFIWIFIAVWQTGMAGLAREWRVSWLAWGLLGALLASIITNLFAFDNAATMAQFWVALSLLAALTAHDDVWRTRFGTIMAPLSRKTASLLRIASLVLALGAVLHASFEALASHLTNEAIKHFTASQNLTMSDPRTAWELTQQAETEIKTAMRFMPAVGTAGLYYGENIQYDTLILIYWAQIRLGPTNDVRKRAYQAMLDTGEAGLRIEDRDPKLLRRLVIEYTDALGEYAPRARQLIDNLLVFEPNSAEVRLLDARYWAATGDYTKAEAAVHKALDLDPTFANAWVYLAEYKNELLKRGDPRGEHLVQEIIQAYTDAQYYGLRLDAADRVIYATSLVLIHRTKEAIAEGRQLHGTPEFKELIQKIQIIYKVYKNSSEEAMLLHALQAP